MIQRGPYLSGTWIFSPPCLENKLCRQTNGCTWEEMDKGEDGGSGGTDTLDRPSVLCSILCLYSLKQFMVSVQVKYMELYGQTTEEVLSRPRHFFCTNGSFIFMFCAVNGVAFGCWTYWKYAKCRPPTSLFKREKKRRHISATEDDLEPFYFKKKNSNNDIIYKVHIHIIVCSTFRNLRSFDWFNVQWRCSPNVHCGNYRRIPMSRLIKGIVLYRLSAFISFCLHIAFQRKGIYLCIQTVGKIHVCKWSSKASRGSRGWTVSSSLWSLSEVLNLWAFFKKKEKKVRQQLLKSNTSVKTLVVAGWKLRFNNWEIRNIWNAHLWMHCWGEPGQLLSVKFQHSTTAHRGNVLLCGRAEAHVK